MTKFCRQSEKFRGKSCARLLCDLLVVKNKIIARRTNGLSQKSIRRVALIAHYLQNLF
jgi:hypothetical protein